MEEELSIEETNKRRAELGLRPLPMPAAADADEDESSLSVEATNKLRVSLGLRPIPDGESALDQDAEAKKNWDAKAAAERAAKDAQDIKKRIDAARERVERERFLTGKSLGERDDDDDVDDVRKWVKRTKKRKLQEDEDKAEAEVKEYTSSDLKGLKVGHQLEDIVDHDGEEVILTLKDRDVLDEGEDELISTEIAQHAQTLKNIENRKRAAKYTGLEDDGGGILSRYDDEEADNSRFFTLDSDVISVGAVVSEKEKKREAEMHAGHVKVSLDIEPEPVSSDYLPAEPVKMRKPKKAKKAKGRTREVDDDIVVVSYDNVENDDEDLQALLARQRRTVQLKRKLERVELEIEEQAPAAGGLVIDDMTEFVGNVGNAIEEDERELERRRVKRESPEPMQDVEEVKPDVKDEAEVDQPTGLEEEAAVSSVGLGATLSMLRSRGLLKAADEQALERQRIQRENAKWKAEMAKHKALAELELKRQRDADRRSGKYDGLTQREREEAAQRENQARQLAEAREAQRRFKNYKPDIKLEYKDEFGRSMNQKEAFKHLSHQFHGKGAGKGKTEKLLKKIEEERKKESKSFFH